MIEFIKYLLEVAEAHQAATALLLFAVPSIYAGAKICIRLYRFRFFAKRITEPDDPDLVELCNFQEEIFEGRPVVFKYEDAKRWLQEMKEDKSQLEEFFIVVKSNLAISGFIYAQHYFKYPYIFISYIATNEKESKNVKYHKTAKILIKNLLKYCNKYAWHAIVTEVEEEFKNKKLHGRAMIRLLSTIAKKSRRITGVYKMEIEYYQPLLGVEKISIGATHGSTEYRQWLLYIPRTGFDVKSDGGEYYLPRNEVAQILELIMLKIYGDQHEESEIYQNYVRNEYEYYMSKIGKSTALSKSLGV